MDVVNFFVLFGGGVLASYVGAIAGGGGGFISLAALLFTGMPLHTAIATNRFGTIGLGVSSTYTFARARKIVYRFGIPLIIFGSLGSFFGARLLVTVNEESLSTIVGVMMLIVVPVIFFQKNVGMQRKLVSKFSLAAGAVGYFFIAMYDGFFGAGGRYL